METGERIAARRNELGISQAELARRIRVSQPLITEIEKGRVRESKHFVEIARELGMAPADLDPRLIHFGGAVTPALELPDDLPVHTLVRSEARGILLPEPINVIPRPSMLARVRNAYGLMVTDDEMSPEFEPGDVLLINPHLPPLQNYSYVFSIALLEGPAMVRRLIENKPECWVVRSWNLTADAPELPKADWPICHRIIGKYSRG